MVTNGKYVFCGERGEMFSKLIYDNINLPNKKKGK